MSKRNKSKGRRINPTYWVFCEGKTEEAYVAYLCSKYRLPIEIVSKIAASNIKDEFIKKSKQGKPTHQKDKDFLLFDGDIIITLDNLKKIKNAQLILSNPSIELWFLYHYKNQIANLNSYDCIRELSNRNRNSYKKGLIDQKLKSKLDSECPKACERAKKSILFDNPSSNVYILIEELEKIKKEK